MARLHRRRCGISHKRAFFRRYPDWSLRPPLIAAGNRAVSSLLPDKFEAECSGRVWRRRSVRERTCASWARIRYIRRVMTPRITSINTTHGLWPCIFHYKNQNFFFSCCLAMMKRLLS
jgi:hypothetical protein